MAASTTADFPVSTEHSTSHKPLGPRQRRRHIDPVSGHALEILGHAIEYLTDELVHKSELILADDPRVRAIQLLMTLNRQIYFACPEVQTFGERCRSFLRLRSA
jgi:hypothetical protein